MTGRGELQQQTTCGIRSSAALRACGIIVTNKVSSACVIHCLDGDIITTPPSRRETSGYLFIMRKSLEQQKNFIEAIRRLGYTETVEYFRVRLVGILRGKINLNFRRYSLHSS
jgi:hypothetical protein